MPSDKKPLQNRELKLTDVPKKPFRAHEGNVRHAIMDKVRRALDQKNFKTLRVRHWDTPFGDIRIEVQVGSYEPQIYKITMKREG